MKFAFLVKGSRYDEKRDRREIGDGAYQLIGVPNLEVACEVARELAAEGVVNIELCGAFGEAGARAIGEAVNNEVAVSYMTHVPEMDPVFAKVFSK